MRDDFSENWASSADYRGQNANMHFVEALMAAYEGSGDRAYLEMATSIAELIIFRHARMNSWVVPEHYDACWRIDYDFDGDPVFNPSGTTPRPPIRALRMGGFGISRHSSFF